MSEQTAGRTPVVAWGAGSSTREGMMRRRYPTIGDLRARAKRRVPSFARGSYLHYNTAHVVASCSWK